MCLDRAEKENHQIYQTNFYREAFFLLATQKSSTYVNRLSNGKQLLLAMDTELLVSDGELTHQNLMIFILNFEFFSHFFILTEW